MMRFLPFSLVLVAAGLAAWWASLSPGIPAFAVLAVLVIFTLLGLYDLVQMRHTLWRNFPLTGRIRWLGEALRPFLRAYIVESETEGRPFNHETRAMVYRRAKDVTSVEPFGSLIDMDKPPYEWLAHSICAAHPDTDDPRILVGAPGTAQPYSASVFNISAMSFGSLGARAIEALNRGAAIGGFYHDSGEGGVSRYHKVGGGDLVYELGSGYFGARAADGSFDPQRFRDVAADPQIKMIEVKLSQGAKPGHGGVLPGEKVSTEIAEARGIPVGQTCFSPAAHSAFSTPIEMMEFLAQLRELSGGKPVGVKFCVGNRWEVLAMMKASLETGIRPDFMLVDGAEGGTGAAPAEFQDHVGMPLRHGLILVRNALVGAGLKPDVRLAASGKLVSSFQLAAAMAIGADWVNSARGFMFALGCIQSLHCHENTCPTGIATTDPGRQRGLVIPDKAQRVASFHRNTVKALMEVVGAAGCEHPSELRPEMVMHRVTEDNACTLNEAYNLLEPGVLEADPGSTHLARDWARAQAGSFKPLS
ncbi:MAG: FMN-binding glutamate synthase family protein [Hyphomonadaceae bacterium]|nr:FMN-binding glutamate synthase family protein [Hyphomonadaceae bacterium]